MTSIFQAIRRVNSDTSRPFILGNGNADWSYGEFFAETGRYANTLQSLGVAAGDRVAVQVEKSVQALALYLACQRLGAIFLPLNTAYTFAELEYFLGDAEPALVVVDPTRLDKSAALCRKLNVAACHSLGVRGEGSLAELAASCPADFVDAKPRHDDVAAILYTSGTTGRAKGAMLTHQNLLSNALTLRECWRFTPDDVLLHALPIFHAHGLFVAANVSLLAGAAMIFLPKFDADTVVDCLPRASVMMGVPTFYTRLLDHPALGHELVRHIRLFISGSAPLLAETHTAWEAKTGHRILERYGMTETIMLTTNPYDAERVAGSVGFPLPDVSLRIVHPDTAAPVNPGEVGMVEVKGPNVFQGYWRLSEKTAAEFRPDGYFITGDLGHVDERGYIHLVGRSKDLIISGGYNIYPKEVEAEIDLLPGVVESAVFGVQHPDFGEGVTAVVILQNGALLNESGMLKALEERLARFKLPKRILSIPELPRNTMGKVQKAELRRQFAGIYG